MDRSPVPPLGHPSPGEHNPYFERYISLVPEQDPRPLLETQARDLLDLVATIDEGRGGFRYAEGKWSIREVIGHLSDTERVMAYRALCIARGEQASLPGFDENAYMVQAPFDRLTLAELAAEFAAVRHANVLMFRQLADADWHRIGTANKHPASPRALAYIMVGHVRHHVTILQERYLR